MKEIWRPVPGKEGIYEVSNLGNIRRCAYLLNLINEGRGYQVVTLGAKNRRYVHRLVAEAFLGPAPFPMAQVNHKDNNPVNNAVENLEWVTSRENNHHAQSLGLLNYSDTSNWRRGESHPRARLTEDQVRQIRALYKPVRGSQTALARQFGVSPKLIYNIVKRTTWKHIS